MPDYAEVLQGTRVLNVVVVTGLTFCLFVRFNDLWRGCTRPARLVLFGLLGIVANNAYGSAESYVLDNTPGTRILILAIFAIITMLGLWLSRGDPWIRPDRPD